MRRIAGSSNGRMRPSEGRHLGSNPSPAAEERRRRGTERTSAKCTSKFIMYYVYLIECEDGTIYTGITTDIQRRFKEHSLGKGGAYTRSKKVKKVLYTEEYKDRSSALKRETEIKGWRREKKLGLIQKRAESPEFIEGLSQVTETHR